MKPDKGHWQHYANLKKEIKNGSVMPIHVECVKRTFNVLASLTGNCNVFFSRTPLL